MAFFKLTMVGHQNKIKDYVKEDNDQNKTNNILEEELKKSFASEQMHTYGNGPAGSQSKCSEMNHKHIRNPKGPNEIFKAPITCSQEIGWWTEDEPLDKKLPWIHVKKHVFPKSEMTAFVDEMSLTDKSFKMY